MAGMDGRSKLSNLLDRLENDKSVRAFRDSTFRVWAYEATDALQAIYGNASHELVTFTQFSSDLPMPLNMVDPGSQGPTLAFRFKGRIGEIAGLLRLWIQQIDDGVLPIRVNSAKIGNAPLKVFIAHGGRHTTLDRMLRFLKALGVDPIVVEDEPSLDRTTTQKVEHYLDLSECAIVLATADDEVGDSQQPRGNVLNESGRIQERFPGKTIWLKEEGAVLPSNISPKVYETFGHDNLERAFVYVAQELGAMGLLHARKLEHDA